MVQHSSHVHRKAEGSGVRAEASPTPAPGLLHPYSDSLVSALYKSPSPTLPAILKKKPQKIKTSCTAQSYRMFRMVEMVLHTPVW